MYSGGGVGEIKQGRKKRRLATVVSSGDNLKKKKEMSIFNYDLRQKTRL